MDFDLATFYIFFTKIYKKHLEEKQEREVRELYLNFNLIELLNNKCTSYEEFKNKYIRIKDTNNYKKQSEEEILKKVYGVIENMQENK